MSDDGFTYYTCLGECGERKMAALFAPAEIAHGTLRCMACMGDVQRRPLDPKGGRRPGLPISREIDATRARPPRREIR